MPPIKTQTQHLCKSSRLARAAFAAIALSWSVQAAAQSSPVISPEKLGNTEEVVELSPFVVNSSQNVGYQATSTLAGTRLNTSLKDVGAAVSVYTQEFLDDINVTKIQDILTYTAGTESGGQDGNFSGVTGENAAAVREDPASVNRVRALASATRTRDFFATDIPGDNYNFDTVTISRGPNAILAGVGAPGGIIDSAMRKATFKDNYRVVSGFSSNSSHREEVHLNKVVIPKRLAVRLDLLNDDKQYRQNPAYESDQRLYAAMQFRVLEPKRGSFLGRGTFRANYESGHIDGVPPDPLTPTFTLENWFNPTIVSTTGAVTNVPANAKYQWWGYSKQTGTPGLPTTLNSPASGSTVNSFLRNSAGQGILVNQGSTAVVLGFPIYLQMALIYSDPTSSTPSVGFTDPALAGLQGFQGNVPVTNPYGGTGGTLRSSGDYLRLRQGFVRTRLLDPAIFNFYENLITGTLDRRSMDFNASDFRYEQLLLGGKAGFEVAYNDQTISKGRNFAFPTGGNDEGILVDVNYYLSVKDSAGRPIVNPNFGRPFISTTNIYRDQLTRIDRQSSQLTAFIKQDFTQSHSNWIKHLGNHTLSSLFFNTKINRYNRTYRSSWDPVANPTPQAALNGAQPGSNNTQVFGWFYLGPSMVDTPTVSDVRLQPISGSLPQFGQTYKVQVFDPATKTFVTSDQTPIRILQNLADQREVLDSTAFALQSHWLKDHVVTVFGWREDVDKNYSSNTPGTLANGGLDETTTVFEPSVAQVSRTWTKSVVAKLPFKFPGDTEVRVHWNQSGNFNPIGQRRNVWNEELGSPSATTEERGLSFTAFRGKLELRVNRYLTKIKDDSVSAGNPYTYINTMIVRMLSARDAGLVPSNYGYNYAGWNSFGDVARAFYETIPARLQANIGSDKNFDPHFIGTDVNTMTWQNDSIINLTSTSDTQSEGTEFEAIINPTRGWRVSVSVSKNEAVKADVAAQELAFAAAWKENLDTLFGGALLTGQRNPAANETGLFYNQFLSETMLPVRNAAASSGVAAPEIRKWRVNFVTRYEFQQGKLRGFSVGGAVRWQDRIGIGYPFETIDGTPTPLKDQPYWGPREIAYDASIGYKRKFKVAGSTINWAINLNVRNLNAKDTLIPIAANADGSWGTFRIPPERTWNLTNSFSL